MAVPEDGGKGCVFDTLRKQKRCARLGMRQGLAGKAHRFEGGAHFALEVIGQRLRAFGVLTFGGHRDPPRQRALELA